MNADRKFEKWYLNLHGSWPEDIAYIPKSESGLDVMYSDIITQSMWSAWQAQNDRITELELRLDECSRELGQMINNHNVKSTKDGSWLYDGQTVYEAREALKEKVN